MRELMRRLIAACALLLLISSLHTLVAAQEVALTFDDLPAHGSLPPGMTRLDVAKSIIATLKAAKAPKVYGFINAIKLEQVPADRAVLEEWRAAGFMLGNHTYSHMSLTDNTPYILAWGNDTAYDRIFVEQLKNFVEKDSVLIAISGSGNSPNVISCIEYANAHGMKTLGVTGYDGGKLKKIAHHNVHVPSWNMGMVESVHSTLFHYLLDICYHKFKALKLAPTLA